MSEPYRIGAGGWAAGRSASGVICARSVCPGCCRRSAVAGARPGIAQVGPLPWYGLCTKGMVGGYKCLVDTCARCGASLGEGHRFCGHCGAPVGGCPSCG